MRKTIIVSIRRKKNVKLSNDLLIYLCVHEQLPISIDDYPNSIVKEKSSIVNIDKTASVCLSDFRR